MLLSDCLVFVTPSPSSTSFTISSLQHHGSCLITFLFYLSQVFFSHLVWYVCFFFQIFDDEVVYRSGPTIVLLLRSRFSISCILFLYRTLPLVIFVFITGTPPSARFHHLLISGSPILLDPSLFLPQLSISLTICFGFYICLESSMFILLDFTSPPHYVVPFLFLIYFLDLVCQDFLGFPCYFFATGYISYSIVDYHVSIWFSLRFTLLFIVDYQHILNCVVIAFPHVCLCCCVDTSHPKYWFHVFHFVLIHWTSVSFMPFLFLSVIHLPDLDFYANCKLLHHFFFFFFFLMGVQTMDNMMSTHPKYSFACISLGFYCSFTISHLNCCFHGFVLVFSFFALIY
ncbi:hypothetical protein DsansV1_C22g0170361 [Dioscorea sansibarensis]